MCRTQLYIQPVEVGGMGSRAVLGSMQRMNGSTTHLLLQLVQLLLGAAVGGAAGSTHVSRQLRAHRLQLGQGWALQRLCCCVVGAAQRVAVCAVAADAICGAPPRLMHQSTPRRLPLRMAPGLAGESRGHQQNQLAGTAAAQGGGRPAERWRRRRHWGFGPHPGLTASESSKIVMIIPRLAGPRARRRARSIALIARALKTSRQGATGFRHHIAVAHTPKLLRSEACKLCARHGASCRRRHAKRAAGRDPCNL